MMLRHRLSDEFPLVNLSHYFTCYQLRAWAVLKGKVVTDQIFIHSKIMLVDDRVAIVGSANVRVAISSSRWELLILILSRGGRRVRCVDQ